MRDRSLLELSSARLLLRPFRASDAEQMYALNEDPLVLQYTGDKQFADLETARAFLANYDQYEKYGVGRLAALLRSSGEIIGWCGLKYHPEQEEHDIGYRFFRKHWGKGYASESAMTVLQDASHRLELSRLAGRARKENLASIRVLEKLGLKFSEAYEEDGEHWKLYLKEMRS